MEVITLEYKKATMNEAEKIFQLVQKTIKTVYPKYYPKEVVEFFLEHHSISNILQDIESGSVGILLHENEIVGTGSYKENHITRVYVLPEYQKRGYGSYILQCLEEYIFQNYDTVSLDASLPACLIYEKRGYQTVKHERYLVKNGAVLVYEIMEKVNIEDVLVSKNNKWDAVIQSVELFSDDFMEEREQGIVEKRETWGRLKGGE